MVVGVSYIDIEDPLYVPGFIAWAFTGLVLLMEWASVGKIGSSNQNFRRESR
jgi:hypothetical protein